jgi:DNA-binding transcriptional LysR family regulator
VAAGHPLARLECLDAGALAATPRLGGSPSRMSSLPTQLAMAAAGEGYALVPRRRGRSAPRGRRPAAAGRRAGVGIAGRPPARDVLSVGTLAVLDALRRVSGGRPPAVRQASGLGAAGQ